MPHYKDTENNLYWLDEGDDPAVWLPQCVAITDEEAEALRPAPVAPEPVVVNPVDKLKAFLAANPDVASILTK